MGVSLQYEWRLFAEELPKELTTRTTTTFNDMISSTLCLLTYSVLLEVLLEVVVAFWQQYS